MAGLYNGYILEFPLIRVDCFTSPPRPPKPPWCLPASSGTIDAPNAQLYLLTHVHSDHLIGLSDDFTGHIICSPDTKRMLLRLEAEVARQDFYEGVKEARKCKYEGLKAKIRGKGTKHERVEDRIEAVPYGLPREYVLGYDNGEPCIVTVTLLEANHCPGSTMFLITSENTAVLHTGDVRADNLFMQSLRRNPAVQEFLIPWPGHNTASSFKGTNRTASGRRTLDRIYLDTSAILGTGDMPDREGVLQDLLQQMSLYPPDTIFFMNVWCFGWEDVVKEVARHFDQPVHVDRYKRSIYSGIKSDPFLAACTTEDPLATRFHACERKFKCSACRLFDQRGKRVYNLDKRIVQVDMVEVKTASWELEHQSFIQRLSHAAIGEGHWPFNIQCPIARHSPLPELQNLVKLFRPRAVSPNALLPDARGIDAFLLPAFLQDCVSDETHAGMERERDDWFTRTFGAATLQQLKAMQLAGISLLPELDGELDHAALLGVAGAGAMVAVERRDNADAQLSRFAGLPSISMGQVTHAIIGPPSRARKGDEEDTDDESHERKRTKRKIARKQTVPSSSSDVKPMTSLPTKSAQEPTAAGNGEASIKKEVAVQEDLSVKKEDADINSRRLSYFSRVGRVSVDKEHLRSLTQLGSRLGNT